MVFQRLSQEAFYLCCFIAFLRRGHAFRISVFHVCMRRSFRMLRGVLDAFDGGGLQSLACIGKSFDRFLSRVRFRGQSLRPAALTSTVVPNLARIRPEFVWTNLRIGFLPRTSDIRNFPLVLILHINLSITTGIYLHHPVFAVISRVTFSRRKHKNLFPEQSRFEQLRNEGRNFARADNAQPEASP